MAAAAPKGPFVLVTVNTAPERAFRLIGRLTEALKENYTIQHAANCETIEEVRPKVEEIQPDLLPRTLAVPLADILPLANFLDNADRSRGQQFCASMWTSEQAEQIQAIAREVKPGIKTHAIPQGLQAKKGPDAIVEYLVANVLKMLEE